MEKLIILFLIANLSQNQINSNEAENQDKAVQEFVYWDTFSKTFDKTADYWKAESEALEAESISEDRTGIEEWLEQNQNQPESTQKDQCESNKC